MLFPNETDRHFREKGATHYYDAHYPEEGHCRNPNLSKICTRHYFVDGMEIGYVLPDLLSFQGHGIHYFPIPRVWGIPHSLTAIK